MYISYWNWTNMYDEATALHNLDHVFFSLENFDDIILNLFWYYNVILEKVSWAEYVITHENIFPDLQLGKCMINTPKVLAMYADKKAVKCQFSEKHNK